MLRLGGDVDYWKSITEFHNMKMGVSDDINEYSDKYIRADNAISVDAYKAAKYFFSLPLSVRTLIGRHSGEWPQTLGAMIKLAKTVVSREESVNFEKRQTVPVERPQRLPALPLRNFVPRVPKADIVCYVCGDKNHVAPACPKRIYGINKSNSNYVPVKSMVKLKIGNLETKFPALIDSGASDSFISQEFVEKNDIFKKRLHKKFKVELAIQGRAIPVKFETEGLQMTIGSHVETLRFLIIPGLKEELILGKSWLKKHNPVVDWNSSTIEFSRCDCKRK